MTTSTHSARSAWIAGLGHTLACRLGWTTLYHVAWTEPMSAGFRIGSMTVTVRPWITRESFNAVRDCVAADNNIKHGGFTLTSVTKL